MGVTFQSEEGYQAAIGLVDLIAGSAGGCAVVFVGQPLDTVKVKMQTFPGIYSNAWFCFRETLFKDGIRRGLYAGTNPALIANVAENSVLFCAYGFCQRIVSHFTGRGGPLPDSPPLVPIDFAIAGFLAAFFSSFTLCPTELIKCKLQALRETGNADIRVGSYQLTRQILRAEGIPGLYRGLTSTMMREMPGYFFFFGGYESCKYFLSKGQPENFGPVKQVMAGGFAGVALWVSIFPFDVAKSRIQIESSRTGMWKVIGKVFRQEGVRGLYKGLLPTVIRTFPATGALFMAYEATKSQLTKVVDSVFLKRPQIEP